MKSRRGFAALTEEHRKSIAKMGGEAVSKNRDHMSTIGTKGGLASAEVRAQKKAAIKTITDNCYPPIEHEGFTYHMKKNAMFDSITGAKNVE